MLACLCSSAQQNHQHVPVAPVVEAVSGAEIEAEFRDAFPDSPVVAEVAELDAVNPRLNPGAYLGALPSEPPVERILSSKGDVLDYP